ncbi:C6 transcription factor [Aspergillus sclerotioniger CBS 115572]|uniref:C6 transcription factor n=1 Tax=Aspergillus sclerotioniger CBS 115572 TaxID=1450535 RepID=A0A317WLQ0_9EURO|nr:C6 transcription factor [Aspergillus sclerotioniger CBS 115572]PWY87259.1 C6 transcription factor [Aspergillus sclerotioniger CBS 115572]
MAAATKIPARSLNGCWTCRVRRKKCDETRPACTRCISLDLECHGYGPRPFWMDNGALQNEQASKFRQMVSQARSRKRRQKLLLSTRSSGRNPAYPFFNAAQEEFHDLPRESDLAAFNALACSAPIQHHPIPTTEAPSIFSDEDFAVSPLFSKNMEWAQNSSSPASSVEGLLLTPSLHGLHEPGIVWGGMVSPEDLGLATSKTTLSDLDDLMWSASLDSPHFQEATLPTDHGNGKPTSDMHALAAATCGQAILWPMSPSDSAMGERAEDELLMHYLDRVFYIQYPFFHSRDRRGRGWLLSILRRVKPAYYASLALSERDLLSTSLSRDEITTRLTQLRAKDGYYDMALQGMQRIMAGSFGWHAPTHLANSLEGLISILQLLFWEIFAGGTKNWQWLLRMAANLIPALVQARMPLIMPDATGPAYPSGQSDEPGPSSEDRSAADFLLGSFISLDIIAAASTRRAPFLEIDHVQALDRLEIPLETLVGCRNSIMALICEVSALDRWKKESEVARKLSIIDLAKRGGQLEERLRQELASLEQMPVAEPSVWGPSPIPGACPTHPGISKAFGLAAIAYLHVVISGAHPELPEIAKIVSEIIVVFQTLRDQRLLQNVVWPFCISGCLALEEHQRCFRDLFAASEGTEPTGGTLGEAYQVMEECWQARKSRSSDCDWVSIMNERGEYVLLR